MSGLEVIGGISAAITIIGTAVKLYDKAKNDKKLPEECNAIQLHLPLIHGILQTCEGNLKPRKASLSPKTIADLHNIIVHCNNTAEQLETESTELLSSKSRMRSISPGDKRAGCRENAQTTGLLREPGFFVRDIWC